MKRLLLVMAVCLMTSLPLRAARDQAPDWMHALVNVPLPAHDEKTDAVILYADENLTVVDSSKFRTRVRRAYKILRPGGRNRGLVGVPFNSRNDKVISMRGWCIPAGGQDYELKDKDAMEVSPLKGESVELITDERVKVMQIPASDPGNIVGYEYVVERRPLVLQDDWRFQSTDPLRESHYSLTLPQGWEHKESWINSPELKAQDAGAGQWQWAIRDVREIREEEDMPPKTGVAGCMIVTLFPPGGTALNAPPGWREMGEWYNHLTNDRLEASPEIKQQVNTLTASSPTPFAKMKALAEFTQQSIRYVAIALGIGGIQPHPAPQVFTHRYGDCKDKATLMISMLREIGVEAFYVVINDERGAVTSQTPAHMGAFNHVVVAIKLPQGLANPALIATRQHPQQGTLLFFDPTNEKIPFGQIGGYLQANYGMLVTPSGGELVELPQQPTTLNGIRRTAKLNLSVSGTLQGDVEEAYVGDLAWAQREVFTSVKKSTDEIKPVEGMLADALSTYQLLRATVTNAKDKDHPFIWNYTFQAPSYAKTAGNLLLVRPRVLGRKSRGLLEKPEPRRYPIEFEGPARDTDSFEITLPPGYVVDDLPPAVDVNFGFASYHARTEVVGNVLHYSRTLEVTELSVPVSKAEDLRKFYRIIASDERNTAVLKPAP